MKNCSGHFRRFDRSVNFDSSSVVSTRRVLFSHPPKLFWICQSVFCTDYYQAAMMCYDVLWCAMMFGESFIDSPNVNLHERNILAYFSLETCPGTAAVGWDILRHVAQPREFEGVAPLWGRKDVKVVSHHCTLPLRPVHSWFLIAKLNRPKSPKYELTYMQEVRRFVHLPLLYVHLTAPEGQAAVWGALWIRGGPRQWLGVFRGGDWMFSSFQVL